MSAFRLPLLTDISRKQFENQFARPPGDAIFADKKKVFFLTGVEASGNWSFSYITPSREVDNRQGTGSSLWYYPVVACELKVHSGIQQFYGFFLQTE